MPVTRITLTTIALAALLAGPALAQQTNSSAPANSAPGGTLTLSHGDFRSSQIVGATVYNDHANSIGTIDNLLVDNSGKISEAVISVGGFLGVDSKLVAVPFSQLKFEQSRGSTIGDEARKATNAVTPNSMHVASSSSGTYYSVVLPGASKDSLTSMASFKYGT